ncbi:MgtC/SapB family protein [Maribacter sp. M208]|nr:MgtC/SapB family protein [Maribacter huludaoensis]MDF4222644.1 MgtC/SapB family protein [Maribacter huludaoensis]
MRAFPIVAILGFTLGSLTEIYSSWLPIIGLGAFIFFLGFNHLHKETVEYERSFTTNIALISTVLLGLMVSAEYYRNAVATAVIIVTLLSLKTRFHTIIRNITSDELFALIKFSIIALLILPFLPNNNYGPNELINPFEIGSIIVIVSFTLHLNHLVASTIASAISG